MDILLPACAGVAGLEARGVSDTPYQGHLSGRDAEVFLNQVFTKKIAAPGAALFAGMPELLSDPAFERSRPLGRCSVL